MKKRKITIIIILVFVIGLALVLYPIVSEYFSGRQQETKIVAYAETVESLPESDLTELRRAAERYNAELLTRFDRWHPTEEEHAEYMRMLDVPGAQGVMGYIRIPKIRASLPIYHTTDDSVLQLGVGHYESSSLPVGGESTHAVISGHRGLPSAILLTDLDKIEAGDMFQLQVLGETLYYEVDRILVVEPDDISALNIEEGKDYCTLITCTPYGINTHRLLVRGQRVEAPGAETAEAIEAEAMQPERTSLIPLMIVLVLLAGLGVLLVKLRKRRKN